MIGPAEDTSALVLFDVDQDPVEAAPARPVTAGGRRRPADPTPVAGRGVHIEVGRRSAWLYGRGLHAAVNKLRIPFMWCPRFKCLTVPIDHVGDLLAYLEHGERRRHVTVEAVDR